MFDHEARLKKHNTQWSEYCWHGYATFHRLYVEVLYTVYTRLKPIFKNTVLQRLKQGFLPKLIKHRTLKIDGEI